MTLVVYVFKSTTITTKSVPGVFRRLPILSLSFFSLYGKNVRMFAFILVLSFFLDSFAHAGVEFMILLLKTSQVLRL